MGTTLVATVFADDALIIGHVGDSRVYRLREGLFEQLTEDHSLLNDYIKMKSLTPEEIAAFPHKNVIVRALGMKDTVQVDVLVEQPRLGDVYVLCSDGLSGMVTDTEIAEVVANERDLNKRVRPADRHGQRATAAWTTSRWSPSASSRSEPRLARPACARGPDPEAARRRTWTASSRPGGAVPDDEEGRRLLVALLSNGSYLADLLLADVTAPAPPAGRSLPAPAQVRASACATRPARPAGPPAICAACSAALRRFARREMLRLGAREIGWGTTLEVAAELSALADACLEEAVRVCDAELRAGYGEPQSPERPPGFVVLGMGKLGGEELNF